MGVVGLLGLVEAMSTAVAERGGEIALLKTVGAPARAIIRMVVAEALATAVLAVAVGVALAVPLTAVVEAAVGAIFVGAPLPYTWWLPGVGIAALAMAGAAWPPASSRPTRRPTSRARSPRARLTRKEHPCPKETPPIEPNARNGA